MRIKIYNIYPTIKNPIGETLVINESIVTCMQSLASTFKPGTSSSYYKSQSGYAGDRKCIYNLLESAEKVKRV